MKRLVEPEILDELPASDPAARRSRRDLRRINFLMGNFRWLRRWLQRLDADEVTEIGAGDGAFLASLWKSGQFHAGDLRGVDLAPRPRPLPEGVDWTSGDVFEVFEPSGCTVANLFLHHFQDDALRELGAKLRGSNSLLVSEPLRSRGALVEGYALFPFVNQVTRHDMTVSIRAGFRRGELPELLGLDPENWNWTERSSPFGAYRLAAWRNRQ